MNWTNYDRLVQHLKTMPPRMFDYGVDTADLERPGCVECQCVVLTGHRRADIFSSDDLVIKCFLGVTDNEAEFIYRGADESDPFYEVFAGQAGIANALHRLDLVASRYTRPTISVNSENNQADREREFLVRCMAVAAEPVEAE